MSLEMPSVELCQRIVEGFAWAHHRLGFHGIGEEIPADVDVLTLGRIQFGDDALLVR